MIPAVSTTMYRIDSRYNKNLGQLSPQNNGLKSCRNQAISQNPSFGKLQKWTRIGIPITAVVGLSIFPALGVATTHKMSEDTQITQAKEICSKVEEVANIECAKSCAIAGHPETFTDLKENLRRVETYCKPLLNKL